uniref:Uncharacterized protein n=1 Tax=Zea mays TaxID=4577 RepID=B8A1V6_MAIZE|nr:unknown [Zea mays]
MPCLFVQYTIVLYCMSSDGRSCSPPAAGLRRLAAAGRHAHDARREGRRPQRRRLHRRLRPHRHHQGAGRGRLPRHRLLRRHPGAHRARRRQPGLSRRPELGRAAGPARRDVPQQHGRGDGPPGPGLRPGRPGGRVRRQGPEPARPRGAVGRAHGGDGALRQLPHPRLLRRQREPGVRRAAAPGLPVGRRRRRARAARLAHPRPVRQRLLPEPHGRRRPAALGPGALQQRRTRLARAPLRHQRRRLLVGLRRVHGQARQHRPAHGFRGGGQAQLQDGEFEFVTSGR